MLFGLVQVHSENFCCKLVFSATSLILHCRVCVYFIEMRVYVILTVCGPSISQALKCSPTTFAFEIGKR